jgi:two-component system, LuxR family, sensor kinase FixL
MAISEASRQQVDEREVQRFHDALGPFVVAVETTRMPMLFTNAEAPGHPIVFANDSFVALMGYEREEVLGRDFDFFFARPDAAGRDGCIAAAIQGESGAPPEVECRRKDGQVFPATMYISPVCDRAGTVIQYFSSFVDVSASNEHKRTLARLLSLQTELTHFNRVSVMGTMAATLAHELNQPLTAIANYASGCRMLLAAGTIDPAEIGKDLTAIEDGAIRAGAIISRMRSLGRGEPPRRESFDLNDAIREAVELVHVGSCRGVAIECDLDGAMPVEADQVQIQQVIINLVRNGCEAAAEYPDARVIVSTRVERRKAIVSVDDTGPGISAERSLDLFEWANSTKPGGMGVGLSISRTIVEAHEGTMWHAPGGRTRFRFSLPLANLAVRRPDARGRRSARNDRRRLPGA